MEYDPLTGISTEETILTDGTRMIKTIDSLGNVFISTNSDLDSWTPWRTYTMTPNVDKTLSDEEWKKLITKTENIKEEAIPIMKVYQENKRYRITCDDMKDLQPDRILKNLSIMKSRLMMECAPLRFKRIECKMTREVKKNLIQAYRKINMYGKKTPFVARFDEYGRRLEDNIKIDTLEGMIVKLIDTNTHGPLYLEFTGILNDTSYISNENN